VAIQAASTQIGPQRGSDAPPGHSLSRRAVQQAIRTILEHPTWIAHVAVDEAGYHYVYLIHDGLHSSRQADLGLRFAHAPGHSPAVMLAALINGTRP